MERIGGGSHRGGPTTALTTSSIHSTTLRDSFLAGDIADKNNSRNGTGRTSLTGLTLAAVLNDERNKSTPTNHSNAADNNNNSSAIVHTLLDILQNEQTLIPNSSNFSGKKTWKSFKDRLKLRRNPITIRSSASSSNSIFNRMASQPIPRSDLEVPGRAQILNDNSLRNSLQISSIQWTGSLQGEAVPAGDMLMIENSNGLEISGGRRMRLSAALAAEREETRRRLSRESGEAGDGRDFNEDRDRSGGEGGSDEEEWNPTGGGSGDGEPMRMSLMDLLEETDQQAGIQGPTYRFDDDDKVGDDDNDEGKETGEGESGGGEGVAEVCCVCMVRHKGAAFIPCGHTFCRMCSRELWVQRGHCPLCNNFILEILDIF